MAEKIETMVREGERICWKCGEHFGQDLEVCPADGSRLLDLDPGDLADPLIGTLFDGVARHTQEGLDFVARAQEVGWRDAVGRWREVNEAHWGRRTPDRNIEYLLYQVLLGSHPVMPAPREELDATLP